MKFLIRPLIIFLPMIFGSLMKHLPNLMSKLRGLPRVILGRLPHILLVLLVVMIGFSWFQHHEIQRSSQKIEKMEQEISSLRLANVLTKDLNHYNSDLTRRLIDLEHELKSVENSSLPLPDDVRRIVHGLQQARP